MQGHNVTSGYNWIRAGDRRWSLVESRVRGDVIMQKVDHQVGSTRASDASKGKRLLFRFVLLFPCVSSPLNGIPLDSQRPFLL